MKKERGVERPPFHSRGEKGGGALLTLPEEWKVKSQKKRRVKKFHTLEVTAGRKREKKKKKNCNSGSLRQGEG